MADLTDSNSTSAFDNELVELRALDNTPIGNVSDSIKANVTNSTGALAVNIQDGGNSITVDATSLPLPTGAATAALQTTQDASINTLLKPASTLAAVTTLGNITGTVSLPTGASTSSLQTTGNSSLSSIDSKTPALGQALAAASSPVVLTAAQLTTLTPLTTVTVTQATGTNLHTVIDSGTVAATQSGTWTVQPGNTANTTAWKVDGSAVTQPISAVSLPLPSGASTSANQTTANTSLSTIASTLTLAQGSTTSGQTGSLTLGAVTTAAPTYTTAQTNPLSLDTAGSLRITGTVAPASFSYLTNNQTFSASASINAALSGTDNPILLLKNPSGSGRVMYISKISLGASVTNVSIECKIYSNPTITLNGTSLTTRQRNIGNSPASGSITAFTLPTLSVLGNQISAFENGQNNNSVVFGDEFTIAVQPNNNIIIVANPSSNNRLVAITAIWVEV